MSVEETQQVLEQFKQSFFQEPTDVDACSSLLPKLKVTFAPPSYGSRDDERRDGPKRKAGAGAARGRGRCVTALPCRYHAAGSARCVAPPPSPLSRASSSPPNPEFAPFNPCRTARRGQVPVAAPAAHGGHQPAGADAREYVPQPPTAPCVPFKLRAPKQSVFACDSISLS